MSTTETTPAAKFNPPAIRAVSPGLGSFGATGRALGDEPLTELGLARHLVASLDGEARYAPEIREWFIWDGRRWIEDVLGEINRSAKSVVDNLHAEATFAPERRDALIKAWLRFQTASRIRSIIELAETEPGVPVRMSDFDSDPWSFNVANGVVDLRTGDIRPHDPRELHSKFVPIDYDPDASAPRWEQFLAEVFNNDTEVIEFVRRFAGYSLSGDVQEQAFVFGHGSGGNGKSILLETLRSIAGDYAIQIDPAVLTASRHDQHPTGLTDLRGARMVTTVETEQGTRLNEALVKQLTGGDAIRARRMRADFFEFTPSHKLWLAGNHLPAIQGTDHGIWRRIALVPFNQVFEGDRRDRQLPQKLAAEREGILAWAVRGTLEWQRDGLQIPNQVQAATSEYRTSQDHAGRFIDDCCTVDPVAHVSAKALRGAYEEWCGGEGERPWTAKALGRELSNRGFDSVQQGSARARTWLGLGIAAQGR